ncbi:hypothetical protein QAD02_018605 [Eretmocerus hayati]|uniref:Uncharacterized protein n=2 Tax=Eretmocerus hayati TaxID=131215 RepID=A0ACC2PIE6_9HYME|nr:hypothetical protein QAD02_018583 [Eretmocerus hayati]KAJ8682813.1 hypothetical protein QAD02_018605 [Eretmocerus hayati]
MSQAPDTVELAKRVEELERLLSKKDRKSVECECDEQISPKEPTVSDAIRNIIGKHPAESQKEVKLNAEVSDRWQVWLESGVPKKERDEWPENYPIEGKCRLAAPKLNPEVESFLGEGTNERRRDIGFTETQNKVGMALSAIGQALSSIMEDDEVDKDQLFTKIWDAGKILTEVQYKLTHTRRAFIDPSIDETIKGALKKAKTGEFLYGEKLTEKITEAKAIQKTSRVMAQDNKPPQRFSKNNKWLKAVLIECNLENFTGHSTRHAAASAAFEGGMDLKDLKSAAGWSEKSKSFDKFYNRPIVAEKSLLAHKTLKKK